MIIIIGFIVIKNVNMVIIYIFVKLFYIIYEIDIVILFILEMKIFKFMCVL